MAYANKYKITFATKTTKNAYVYIQEDGYTGALIEYIGINLELQYLPESDDVFEPIFASQLNLAIDITDDVLSMPDFVTLNDRKYFVKLYLGTDLQWTGFSISDNVQVQYSTGRKELSFSCIDGIGMLKSIPFDVTLTTNSNLLNSLLFYIRTSLNSLQLPTDPNIITACSLYAYGMQTRTTHSYSEPFPQSYLPYRTFQNEDNTYISCYDVVRNILLSFGCRLFMANGKWWIVSINQFASTNVWFTEYSSAGAVITSGQFNSLSTIQAYTNNTSGLYFLDNSQFKILRKGYNRIEETKDITTAYNYFSNGNFRPYIDNQASNWNAGADGTSSITIIDNVNEGSAQYRFIRGLTGIVFLETKPAMSGQPAAGPFINGAERIKISWVFQGQDLSGYRGEVYLSITSGTEVYYYNGTTWINGVINSFSVPAYSGGAGDAVNSYSFQTTITPISGQVAFKLQLEAGTCNFIQISNIKMQITALANQIKYFAFINDLKQYVKTIDLPYGFYSGSAFAPVEKGILVSSTGSYLTGWFEYGKVPTYASLTQLMMQLYMNCFGKNVINVECNLSSFETTNGYLNGAKQIKATDTDPAQINISNNSYMLGNTTINYGKDETQSTLLQISDIDISCTNSYELFYNTLI